MIHGKIIMLKNTLNILSNIKIHVIPSCFSGHHQVLKADADTLACSVLIHIYLTKKITYCFYKRDVIYKELYNKTHASSTNTFSNVRKIPLYIYIYIYIYMVKISWIDQNKGANYYYF